MSIENCPNEIVLSIMTKLDEVSIHQLGSCQKRLNLLSQDNHLWKHKLHINFPTFKPESVQLEDSRGYYRFYYQLTYNLIVLDQLLENCKYEIEITKKLLKHIHEAIRQVGFQTCTDPQTVINHLINNTDCPYDFEHEDTINFLLYLKGVISKTFGSQTFGSQKKGVVIHKLNNKLNQIEQFECSMEELEKRYKKEKEELKTRLTKECEEYQQMTNSLY